MSESTELRPRATTTSPAPAARHRAVDPLAYCLFGLCLLYGAYTLCISLSPRVAVFAMERSQLADDHFVRWAMFAPAPFMYNFENRVVVSARPLSSAELEDRATTGWLVLNHYPARALTYFELRRRLFARPNRSYVYLESRYREQRVVTGYHVAYASESEGGGASIVRLGAEAPTPSPERSEGAAP
jgi:hypothetical protein